MVKRLSLLIALLLSQSLSAQEFKAPKEWAKEINEQIRLNPRKLPRFVIVLSDIPGKQKAWDSALYDFSDLGWFHYIDSETVRFPRNINPPTKPPLYTNDALAFTLLPGHFLVDEQGPVLLAKVPNGTGVVTLTTAPPTAQERSSAASFLEWVHKALGYEAMVLDVRGKFVLAALVQSSRNSGQGILVKDSAQRTSLQGLKVAGEALLNARIADANLAVFEVLVAKKDGTPIEVGSKILLGKK